MTDKARSQRRSGVPVFFLPALLAAGLSFISCGGQAGENNPASPFVYEPVNEITEPEHVTVSDTEAVFTWVTDSLSDTHVWIGEDEPATDLDLSGPPTRVHYAHVRNLRPETAYRYRLVSGDKAAPVTDRSPGLFRTLGTPPGEYLFSFATLNDSHVGEEVAGLICLGGVCLNEGFRSPWPDRPYWEFTNRAAVEAINRLGPAFVIHKGDITSEFRQEEFVAARNILDGLRMPYHVLRGNHDRAGKPGEREEDYFRTVFALDRTWRHFLYADHLFLLLDSCNPETGLPAIGEEQFRWLQDVLEAYPDKRGFLFLHHAVTREAPLWALTPADRDRLVGLLAAHGRIAGVFSGHSHRAFVSRAGPTGEVPFVETPAAKEYPGGFCLYRVYQGGYLQTFYRSACSDCLDWFEITKGEYWGLAPAILFGRLSDRNFVYRYAD